MKRAKSPPHPWDQWFGLAGPPGITLLRGDHYRCSQANMSQLIRNEASKRRINVTIEDLGDGIKLIVRGGRLSSSVETDEFIATLPEDEQ